MPNIDVFVTSILSNPQLRGRHERVRRALASVRVPYAEHDVAADEKAKSLWKRKNGGKNELPFILVDGEPLSGGIDDLDEAVEFGELRQFLRLDAPPPAATALNRPKLDESDSFSSATSTLPPAPETITIRTPVPPPKPSLDDFADLDLTEAELAELAREISNGDTFSSGLGSSHDSTRTGYDFSDATRRFEGTTAPLKIDKINFSRALPDRPLASEVVKDELEGIDQDELDFDELEQLAKELEQEELERRRLRDAQLETGTPGIEPPPLPEKHSTQEAEPAVPEKLTVVEPAPLPQQVATSTSVEGAGGASLSAPIAEIERLHVSTNASDLIVPNQTLTLESPLEEQAAPTPSFSDTPTSPSDEPFARAEPATAGSSFLASVTKVFTPPGESNSTTTGQVPERKKSTPIEVEHLKKTLEDEHGLGGDLERQGRVTDLPRFGVSDMDPNHVTTERTEEPEEVGEVEEQ
ncbi:uncharacterized protein JCM15063_001274 [Sporobolomyces koalae]|uniref:uncharacterized protein n=1 Tax=Sporobolomyces koalae TaxID=500713 RepID=UPI00316BDC13